MRIVSRAGVLLIIAALVLPGVLAKTFTAPYGVNTAAFSNESGCRFGELNIQRTTGFSHVFAQSCFAGRIDATGAIGSVYTVNSGSTLGQYQALTTGNLHVKGHLSCIQAVGDTKAELKIQLQKWRQSGASWLLEETQDVETYDCFFFSFVDETTSGSRSFTFAPGNNYRIMVETKAITKAFGNAEATVDFCDTGSFRCSSGSEKVTLQSITIPNQSPRADVPQDTDVWYVNVLITGSASVTGKVCDADGTTVSITVSVDGFGSSSSSGNSACLTRTHTFNPTPGSYNARASGRDNENANSNQDVGRVNVELLPAGLAGTAAGFPNLATIPRLSLGPSVLIETLSTTAGVVRAHRVTTGGVTYLDTLTTTFPDPTDVLTKVTYDRVISKATIKLDGVTKYDGLVAEPASSLGWWNIVPLGEIRPSADSEFVPPTPTTFTTLATEPYSETYDESITITTEGS